MTALFAEPRPYQGPDDLDAMRRVLISGGRAYSPWAGGRAYSPWAGGRAYSASASSPAFYVHVGDLDWWLYYGEPETPHEIYLWEGGPGGESPAGPLAWALFSPYQTFDVFAHPAAVTAEQRLAMFAWAEEHLAARLRAEGGQQMSTIWISEHDAAANAHLAARGFRHDGGDDILFMARRLDDLGPAPPLPPGFRVRAVAGEHEVEMRAAAQHSAFQSSWDMARYVARYRRFMQSPVYEPERDLVAIAPDGQAAAFCFVWLDDVNRTGHFEPVGTHAAFHRQGLGKAVLWAGLHLMKARGMETATVCPDSGSIAAVGLYRAVGFEPVHELWTWSKEVSDHA